ncbi:MAG: ATP-binding protein, partial [Rhodobacteraceae bacterium]|nr:ATP-binding protein [Paracoccaceae bacterium]
MEVSFKARARTLDMLGRQQIAGIPTAVSELFKNAHDANATRVEVDYFRKNGLFVLRDDGFGMSMEEFVDRWLAIATETSLNRKRSNTRRPMNAASARPILGEKGIGRLAIATIAPQALVLTRSLGQGVCSDLTAAFVNWRFFGCPRLNLQDVQIPLRTLPGGELPNGEHVLAMVRQFRTRNEKLREKMDGGDWDKIEADLAKFELDPLDLADILGEPSLLAEGHGTHFYLLPAHSDLIFDIEGEPKSDLASPLQKALLGFTAPSFSTETQPTIRTAFRDHRLDGTCEDLIGEGSFFTRQDFESADHHVYGRFDEYGQFRGSVSVYGNSVDDHVINWSEGKGRRTDCGPFQIQFAAFEGLPGNSRLPPTRHGPMLKKTRRLGGLYIYRDGVRIQPYGNTDYDWLEIELRRTKSASYYYFSYRQMFGTVSIDSVHNRKLQEKAGREGFRENKAYRQLRSILKNFLVQVAADFFREEGIHGERLAAQKREFAEDQRHQRARSQTVAAERRKLKKDLSNFFERLETERPLDRVLELGKDTESRVREASDNADFPDAAKRILHIERCALKELDDLEARLAVERPRVGLTRPLQLDWGDYQEAYGELRSR